MSNWSASARYFVAGPGQQRAKPPGAQSPISESGQLDVFVHVMKTKAGSTMGGSNAASAAGRSPGRESSESRLFTTTITFTADGRKEDFQPL